MLGIEAGSSRQLVFLARIGLLEPIRTEIGPVAPPLLPQSWGEIETATISYGHGLALAPLQMAAAAAILVNGGRRVLPTYLVRDERNKEGDQILSPATSIAMRELMRLNVTVPYGTGRRAELAAYRVGGKTGTAEMPGKGGYQAKSVISSFLGAFPMDAPRYVLMVTLFEPKSAEDSKGGITAGLNAAPLTAAIVERIAPILGVLPRRIETIR
jgi:cell division protein FtsI (penicillin-binding protein 3)